MLGVGYRQVLAFVLDGESWMLITLLKITNLKS